MRQLRSVETYEIVYGKRFVSRYCRSRGLQGGNRCSISCTRDAGDEVKAQRIGRVVGNEAAIRGYTVAGIAPVPIERGLCRVDGHSRQNREWSAKAMEERRYKSCHTRSPSS